MSGRKRNKKKNKEKRTDESWLLPYSDMLTLLLALFIVLFAMSEVDVKKFEKLAFIFETEFKDGGNIFDGSSGVIPDETVEVGNNEAEEDGDDDNELSKENLRAIEEYEQLKAMQDDIEEYIGSNSLVNTLGTKLTSEGLLLTMQTDITFDSGSAKVKEEGRKIAKEIAKLLDTDPPHEIVINGHADDRPMNNEEFASNWELSSMRAIQFMYLLMDDSDISPRYFSSRGYGEYQPVVKNTSEHNRTINRRVEVLIQPNYDIEDEVEVSSEKEDKNFK